MGVGSKYYNLLREARTEDNCHSEVSNSKGLTLGLRGGKPLGQSMHLRTSNLSVKGGGSHFPVQAGGAGKKTQRLCCANLNPRATDMEDGARKRGQGQIAQPYIAHFV